MSRSLPPCAFLLVASAFVLAGFEPRALHAEQPEAPSAEAQQVDAQQIAAWIEQLGDDDYGRREAAMEQLAEIGPAAIDALAAAVASDSPEIAWRAGELLEQIGVSGDEQTVERVARAMQALGARHARFNRVAAEMQTRWREFRHARAAAEIRRLGGEVQEGTGYEAFAYAPVMPYIGTAPLTLEYAIAGEEEEVVDGVIDITELVEVDASGEVTARKVELPPLPELPAEAPGEEAPSAVEPAKEAAEEDKPSEDKPRREDVDASKTIDEYVEKRLAEEPPILEPVAEDVPGTAERAEAALGAALTELTVIPDISGDVIFTPDGYAGGFYGGGGYAITDLPGTPAMQRIIRLGAGWKGSDEDLRILRDLNGVIAMEINDRALTPAALEQIAAVATLQQLTLQNAKFDRAAIRRFKQLRPHVTVHAFGKAILGVSGEPIGDGFHIDHVVPQSGAAKAGLVVGDVIRRIEGEPVVDFETLTLVVGGRAPGDVVSVEYSRGEKRQTVKATLGSRE